MFTFEFLELVILMASLIATLNGFFKHRDEIKKHNRRKVYLYNFK